MEIIEQILLHLYNSVDYGFSYTAKRKFGLLEYFDHWNSRVRKDDYKNVIRQLNRSKLIKKKKDYNGSIIISLTEKGKLRALNISFKRFSEKKEKWDGKWRMVSFDIPNELKKGRDAVRYRMRIGGFYQLQDSLFIYPYDCKKEIMALVDLFKLQKYVRFGVLDFIDNEEQLKRKFKLY